MTNTNPTTTANIDMTALAAHADDLLANLPVEIAIHTPGKGWTRKTFKTEAAAVRHIAKLDDDCEVRWAV